MELKEPTRQDFSQHHFCLLECGLYIFKTVTAKEGDIESLNKKRMWDGRCGEERKTKNKKKEQRKNTHTKERKEKEKENERKSVKGRITNYLLQTELKDKTT